MLQEKYTQLDRVAAPNSYTVPPASDDLAYSIHFRKMCQRYHINFAEADQDERAFVIHMAEKSFFSKQA